MSDQITLFGRLFIHGDIVLKTGLHIGGSGGAFAIGTVDNTVITNPMTGQPYIPGSSLRGKIRSLTEKYLGLPLRSMGSVKIHQPNTEGDYFESPVAQIYGIPAMDFSLPTRLIVRDVDLRPDSAEMLRRARTELPFTEVKWEVSIDRVTSQANPRQMERVPAGAVFGPMEMVFSFYRPGDVELLATLFDGMLLLEDDYLGGQGSRGSGKIAFSNLVISLKGGHNYRDPIDFHKQYDDLAALLSDVQGLQEQVAQLLPFENG